MRALLVILAIAMPLGACGKSDEAGQEGEGAAMTANAISSNDITAIDAVTGEAANMAADIDIDANLTADENGASTNQSQSADRPRRPARPSAPVGNSSASAPENAAAPEGNSAQ